MESKTKFALLDTDFISKAQIARNEDRSLADLVLGFEDYEFFCHEKIVEELGRHSISPGSSKWLSDRIAEKRVHLYTDSDVLHELSTIYGDGAWNAYTGMLRTSCNAFSTNFFQEYYSDLTDGTFTNESFLQELKKCDSMIPEHSSMGEKKTYVLVQTMQFFHPGQVCIFCSDDGNARRNLSLINSDVNCLSILSAFQKIHNSGMDNDMLQKYYESYTSFLAGRNQKDFHVWMETNTPRRMRVPMEKVYEDLINDRFIMLANGDLKYKEHKE